jgi:hypothetical protein
MLCDLRAPNRRAPTPAQRLSPLWWLCDDEMPAGHSTLGWFLRNPCCNFLSCVVGIAHRYRNVYVARGTGWTFCDGINWGYSSPDDSIFMVLPFVSFRSLGMEGMIGWKTSGGLGMSLRVGNAKGPQ